MPLPGTRTSFTTGRAVVTTDDTPKIDNTAKAALITTAAFITHHHIAERCEYYAALEVLTLQNLYK